MTTVPTTPKSEQIQFRSEKTGTHNLDTYLEACELGTAPNVKTLPNVLGTLFDNTTGAVNSSAVQFRIKPNTVENILQNRFGTYTNPNDGWVDMDQTIFRQKGAYAGSVSYNRLDMVEDQDKYWICKEAHTSTGTLDQTKWSVVFDGNNVLAEITTFNQTTAPRLKQLEDEVLLQLGVV